MTCAPQFANDPRNLVAASEEMNQEKSDSGPSEWLPPVPELRCTYVENFVDVLDAYDLGINAADKAAAASGARGLLNQRQSSAIAALPRVRTPIDQKIAGGTEPFLRWRTEPMPSSAPIASRIEELHAELDVVQVVRDAPGGGEDEARDAGDAEAPLHQRRDLQPAVVRLDRPGAEEHGEADEVDEDDEVTQEFPWRQRYLTYY